MARETLKNFLSGEGHDGKGSISYKLTDSDGDGLVTFYTESPYTAVNEDLGEDPVTG